MIEDRLGTSAFHELAGELISRGFGFRFHARGRSMFPTIRDGEILCVEPVEEAKLRVGDIALFRHETGLKAHRIIRKQGDKFVMRGDAGVEPDGAISAGEILGKVIAKECIRTRRIARLDGAGARMSFFWSETRMRISRLLR